MCICPHTAYTEGSQLCKRELKLSLPYSIGAFLGKKLKARAFDGFLHEQHCNEEAKQLPTQPSESA